MSSQAKNIEAICNAIKKHDAACKSPATEVVLNPFEWDRLGWDEVMGIPITSDPKVATGRILILCPEHNDLEPSIEEEEIVDEEFEITRPNRTREIEYV